MLGGAAVLSGNCPGGDSRHCPGSVLVKAAGKAAFWEVILSSVAIRESGSEWEPLCPTTVRQPGKKRSSGSLPFAMENGFCAVVVHGETPDGSRETLGCNGQRAIPPFWRDDALCPRDPVASHPVTDERRRVVLDSGVMVGRSVFLWQQVFFREACGPALIHFSSASFKNAQEPRIDCASTGCRSSSSDCQSTRVRCIYRGGRRGSGCKIQQNRVPASWWTTPNLKRPKLL
eukprot:gene305-biopygen280